MVSSMDNPNSYHKVQDKQSIQLITKLSFNLKCNHKTEIQKAVQLLGIVHH